jgi:hypothetical protein
VCKSDSYLRVAASVTLIVLLGGWTVVVGAARVSPSRFNQIRDDWTITFRTSGGVAGISRLLTLSSSGQAQATDRRRASPITGSVTAAELRDIEAALDRLKGESPRLNNDCRDCIRFDVEVSRNGRRTNFQVDETTVAGSELNSLVNILSAIVNRILTTP